MSRSAFKKHPPMATLQPDGKGEGNRGGESGSCWLRKGGRTGVHGLALQGKWKPRRSSGSDSRL